MDLIRQNPYHVIGITAGANQKTIVKQRAMINAILRVGKQLEFSNDLKITGNPDRSNGAVDRAFASIEINQSKLFHALFWFANHNHIDEAALNHLQSGDIEKAEDIWHRTTSGKNVSDNNFTAFNNLGTLKLAEAFDNNSIIIQNLEEGVRLKTELLTSDIFNKFCHFVADETYTVDRDKELENFINALLGEADKINSKEAVKIAVRVGSIHPKIKSFVSEKVTDTPIHNIELKTEQTKKTRKENPKDGLKLAEKLYRDTESDLNTLSDLLGKTDLKYEFIADKLAKELIFCGIDYFSEFRQYEKLHDGDLGADVMKLLLTAKSIAVGTQTNDRIADNIAGLQEWIDNADIRRIENLIGEDLAFVAEKLDRFKRLSDTIKNVDDLVTSCRPKLQNMKRALGPDDDFYLKLSSAVVSNAQGMLVNVVNIAQEHHSVRMGLLDDLKSTVREAMRVLAKLGTFDMVPELKEQYQKNHHTLNSIGSQLGISSPDSTGTSARQKPYSASSTSAPSEGAEIPNWVTWVIIIITCIIIWVIAS